MYTVRYVSETTTQIFRWSGLPEVTVYGKDNKEIVTIGQSNACLRYIGSLCGLYPDDNPLLAALCDEVLDACEDTRSAIMGEMATKEGRAKLVAKDGGLTYWLTKFELRLKENEQRGDNGGGYVCGNALSIADLKLFELFHSLWLIFESNEDMDVVHMNNFPNIVRHYKLILENESVKRGLQRLSLRFSEFKMDPDDEDIKTQTYKGKFVSGTL